MLVCRRWHTIVAADASLWAIVDTTWKRATPRLLDRSKDKPLTVVTRDGYGPAVRDGDSSYSTDANGLLTSILTSHSRRISRYIWTQRTHPAAPPSLPLFTLALTAYPVPKLKVLDIKTDHWDPDLNELLTFFSGTPLLRDLKVSLNFTSYTRNGLETVRRAQSHPPITLKHLERFFCIVQDPTSPVILLLSRLDVPRLREVRYVFSGRHLPTESSSAVFSRLLPFSFHTIRPRRIDFYESRDVFIIKSEDLAEPVGIRAFDIVFTDMCVENEKTNDAIIRRGNLFMFVRHILFDLSSIVSLRCHMNFRKAIWNSLLSTSDQLTSLHMALGPFELFLPVFLWRARAGAAFLPSLSAIIIDVGDIDAVLVPGETWLSMLQSEHLIEALSKRLAAGTVASKLETLRIAVPGVPLGGDLEKLFHPPDWMEVAPYFSRIRELAQRLLVGYCDCDLTLLSKPRPQMQENLEIDKDSAGPTAMTRRTQTQISSNININYLPDELLGIVFDEIVEVSPTRFENVNHMPITYPNCLVTLIRVCGRWHRVVMERGSLWGYIDTGLGKAATSAMIHRSLDAPLSIVVHQGNYYVGASLKLWSSPEAGSAEFVTGLFTAHSRRIRKYVWRQTIAADASRHLFPILRTVPLSGYQFPSLEELDLSSDWWAPTLGELLDFLSATPLLGYLQLSVNSRSGSRTDNTLGDARRPITMKKLQVFKCNLADSTSSTLFLLSSIKAPKLREVNYSITLPTGPAIAAIRDSKFSPLLPFSFQTTKPLELDIGEGHHSFRIKCRDLIDAPRIRSFDVEVDLGAYDPNERPSVRAMRCNKQYGFVHRTLLRLDLSCVVSLRCHLPLLSFDRLFSPVPQLTTVEMSIMSFRLFLFALARRSEENAHMFLPALSTLNIDVSCIDGILVPGLNWLSTTEAERLNGALTKRLAAGLPMLHLRINTIHKNLPATPVDGTHPETLFSSFSWQEVAPHFWRLRKMVHTLTITVRKNDR